jgi:nucleotide-binding universal stress UspA family protein
MITIFHPSDFSPGSEAAFAHALKIALTAKARLQIMHVAPGSEVVHWTDFPGVRSALARWKILPQGSRSEDVASVLGLYVEKIIARSHDPVQSILRHLGDYEVDLIVLATHQREGIARWLHGSVAEPVARRAKIKTLFVPQAGKGFVSFDNGNITLAKILLPVDRTPHPQDALNEAVALASGLGREHVTFTVLHIGDDTGVPAVQTPERQGWQWQKITRGGDVVDAILQLEEDWSADLMVLATEGRHGFMDALRGSTTERLLRRSRCPVLAVPVAV